VDDSTHSLLSIQVDRDNLTDAFAHLRALLAEAGAHVALEDLLGSGGALFRTYWYLAAGEGSPRRWSSRSADVCLGDPLARATEAYGFRLTRAQAPFALAAGREPVTIERRVDALKRSIAHGLGIYDARLLRADGIFASGAAAYDALIDDLTGPLERFIPGSEEEAVWLTPEVARLANPGAEHSLVLSLVLALARTLRAFGTARIRLAVWLDRAGNFIDSTRGLGHFRREGTLLVRASEVLVGPHRADRTGKSRGKSPGEAILSRCVRHHVQKAVRSSAREHRRGMDDLRRALSRPGS
jgi:hypothetical protein